MEHDLQMSEKTAQIPKSAARMLRGYDPLRAIHQWNLISFLFFSELILVSLAALPTFNSAFFLAASVIWGIRPGFLVPLFLLLGAIPWLVVYKHYREERQERARSRHKALMLSQASQVSAQDQPSPTVQQWPLPMRVISRRKQTFTRRITLEIVLLSASLIAMYAVLLSGLSQPRFFYALPGLLALVILCLSSIIWLEMRLPIAGHYLLPSLTIDDDAITARYGRSTITIAWHDIRYFALVSSTTFRQIRTSDKPPTFRQILRSGLTTNTPAPEHEAFEISDGENIICWLKATPFRHYRLFRFGEVALSDEDYAAFTQQLVALIMARTGLPLYDLRLAKHKK